MEEKDAAVARKPGNVCDTVYLVDSAAANLGLPRGVYVLLFLLCEWKKG